MPTRHEYAKQPIARRLERLARTADELAAAIRGQSDAVLSRRPDSKNWAAKEVVRHLRDLEELLMIRFRTMLAMDEPKFLVLGEMPHDPAPWGIVAGEPLPLDPDRWAEERQYLRNNTDEALAALRKRREETLAGQSVTCRR
jgi:DinB family protein